MLLTSAHQTMRVLAGLQAQWHAGSGIVSGQGRAPHFPHGW